MAVNAGDILHLGCIGDGYVMHEVLVAIQAVAVENFGAGRLDSYRLVEVLQGESLGMMIAVTCLCEPFGKKGVWHMAVITGGYTMVASFLPTVVLLSHDVAVHTGTGVIG